MAVRHNRTIPLLILVLAVTACNQQSPILRTSDGPETTAQQVARERREQARDRPLPTQSVLGDLFVSSGDPNTTIEVNKYIWAAALDVLDFLPIENVDPFSGVIVTGFGTPPGGRTAFRATVFVRDPALEGRSLNLALATRNGPASAETVRAVEDAILTRARQLRIQDLGL